MSQLQALHVRWTVRVDYPALAELDRLCFPVAPWDEKDLRDEFIASNRIGQTAELYERTVGWVLYELSKTRIEIVRLAVHPDFRRQGVGASLVARLQSKLSPCRRRALAVDVRETNLDALLFFKAQGFRAYKVARGFYADTSEDAVFMEHRPYDPSL